ncbi:DMT family transporter [bacterium]|nr:DMT family transporter [bacterium]
MGELYSFLCAIFWAAAVVLFKKTGESIRPVSLNLFKNLLGLILIFFTMLLFKEELTHEATWSEYLLLMISGVLGIGLADTIFFKSLNILGAGLQAVVDCFYSPMIIVLSFIFLKERISLLDIFGAILIISAILIACLKPEKHKLTQKELIYGIFLGFLSMLLMAVGIVMIKPLLDRSPLLWVTEIRLIGGTISLVLLSYLMGYRKVLYDSFRPAKVWKQMIPASFLGAYCGLIFWMAGMKYTTASLASILNQTSTIFIAIFAVFFLKEKMSRNRIIGVCLAMLGVIFVSYK